ncbi:PD-(D/E)XK nuclease family transposase [uncultured Granulicatella sp.]|uniref:PD-(D/E)XK nuclease family transposase n=1 Tax=uncultured Granulicatella sp. TaxID=316089 RepID=UPI0028D37968|nr:PD-(D/E)XK nuclease family transposase [uncultured Granulicatella sp.]
MKERIEGARPMMDMMAKKIFSNTSVTAQFIRDIFDLPVESVKILESTQIHEFYLDEFPYSTHIDVLAELDDHTQIIIEIQVALQIDFIKRLCLYLCEQISKNMNMYKMDGT